MIAFAGVPFNPKVFLLLISVRTRSAGNIRISFGELIEIRRLAVFVHNLACACFTNPILRGPVSLWGA